MKSRKGKIIVFLALPTILLALAILLWVAVSPSQAALTQTYSQTDEWAEVAQNAVREGATTTISDAYVTTLYIDYALTSATAHTGTKISVQVSSNTSGDEDWSTFMSFLTLTGTTNVEALGGSEAAAQTVLEVASTTGLYDDDETRWIFIEDNTVANSEMCLLVSHVANTSVTVQDGITNAHDTSDILNDIADRVVVSIPLGYSRVRVIYDNTYDSDGATCHTHCAIVEVTAIQ
jgi:hypothetical protein